MEGLYFIVNPVAGAGGCARRFAQVEQLLTAQGITYEKAFTEGPLHAAQLARAALERGMGRIVAAGGDGTVNEVASALCGEAASLGILPFGTGNDLARTLGLPTEPEAALAVILAGAPRPMDAGRANGRFFVNIAGFGFDVEVLRRTEAYKARFRGMLPYLLGIASAFRTLTPRRVTLQAGDITLQEEALLVSIGNGQYFGGGMRALPEAQPFDGLLDICLVRKLSRLRFLRLLPCFLKGGHMGRPEVLFLRAERVTLDCAQPDALQLDGEVCLRVPAVFELLPGALNVLLPAIT